MNKYSYPRRKRRRKTKPKVSTLMGNRLLLISSILFFFLIGLWVRYRVLLQLQLTGTLEHRDYSVNVTLENTAIPPEDRSQPSRDEIDNADILLKPLAYRSTSLTVYREDSRLTSIVKDAVELATSAGFSSRQISISLIDLKESENYTSLNSGSYEEKTPRYPASIAKIFWMAYLYHQEQAGLISQDSFSEQDVIKMIYESDNEAASRVLDLITHTTSGPSLPENEFREWNRKRESINQFYREAGFLNANISQKTFPIPYLDLDGPTGRELQMRRDPMSPRRNYLTTESVAKLLSHIATEKLISPAYSQKMLGHLRRDLNPSVWQGVTYNWIQGYLGEGLPASTTFASKAGWTSQTRHDAAIVGGSDQLVHYVLVVFGEDSRFSEDETIFPKISKLVYERMKEL